MLLINNLLRHNADILPQLNQAVTSVLESGWYILGTQVVEFEQEFAKFCGVEHCVAVANGTDALELALRTVGVSQGDRVITVANAGGYSTTAILAVGAVPLYVDVCEDSLLLSLEHLQELIGSDVGAIVVTHLYGQIARIEDVVRLADQYGIPVIEDCAQTLGAMLNDRRAGSFGKVGCFSFYPTKNLGALGDGGAVTTDDPELCKRLQMLRQYGWQSKYEISLTGGRNSRLDELQAAILRVKLPYLDTWNRQRFEIARRYVEGIRHAQITTPRIEEGSFVAHLFVVRTKQREILREYLKQHQIMSEPHYPIPDHLQPATCAQFVNLNLPQTELACREVLTLPCFPEMSDAEVQHVINAVNAWPGE